MKTFEVFNHACSGYVESELIEKLGGENDLWKYRFLDKAGNKIETCCPGYMIKNFEPVDFFQPGLEIETEEKGYRLIVDRAEEMEDEDGIKVFWKYLENGWAGNSFSSQFKKIHEGYNFIIITPEDSVRVIEIQDKVLRENRYSWYFDEYVNPETIIFLEKKLGYWKEPGTKTWYEYFLDSPSGRVPKKTGDGKLYWIDMTDPKNPKYPDWVVGGSGKEVVLKKTIIDIEELIDSIHND